MLSAGPQGPDRFRSSLRHCLAPALIGKEISGRIAASATEAGIGWTIGSNLELGIGTAAHLQLAFGADGLVHGRVSSGAVLGWFHDDACGGGSVCG